MVTTQARGPSGYTGILSQKNMIVNNRVIVFDEMYKFYNKEDLRGGLDLGKKL